MRRHHYFKRIMNGVMALAVVCSLMPAISVHAASEYTVTFRPGNVGRFGIASSAKGETSVKDMAQEVADVLYGAYDVSVTENGAIKVKVPSGEQIPAAPAYIIPDEGYCVRTWGPEQGAQVSKNVDYVVDYGRLTDGVEYTVKYIDEESGESIAPFAIAYANVGESVISNAPAIITTSEAGSYVLTSASSQEITLDADAASNMIVFNYAYQYNPETIIEEVVTVVPGDTVTTTETITTVIENGAVVEPGAVQVQNNDDNEADNGNNGADNQGAENDVVNIEDEDTPLADTVPAETEDEDKADIPAEIIEIEDGEVPLVTMGPESGINFAVILAGILGIAMIIVSVLWIRMRRKRTDELTK